MAMDFIAGCIGGCGGVVVGHPFDTIKVRLQTQDYRNPAYRGTFDCFRSIIKNDSVSGLFKGMSSPMAGVSVINAIVFGVQGNIQRRMPNPDSLTAHFASGTAAGVAQSIFCSPMEMVKTRLQIQESQVFKSPWECLKHIANTEGVRGVFRGLGITAMREGPGFGVYFLAYELLTKSDKPISTLHMLLAGGTAGSVSWLFAYPIDVLKTRLQVDGMNGPRLYKNAFDCCIKSVRTEGYGCLTRGLGLTLIRAFPVNAVTWTVVTWTYRLVDQLNANKDAYPTLSELAAIPDLTLNKSYCAKAERSVSKKIRFSDQDLFMGTSSILACKDDLNLFQQLFKSGRISPTF